MLENLQFFCFAYLHESPNLHLDTSSLELWASGHFFFFFVRAYLVHCIVFADFFGDLCVCCFASCCAAFSLLRLFSRSLFLWWCFFSDLNRWLHFSTLRVLCAWSVWWSVWSARSVLSVGTLCLWRCGFLHTLGLSSHVMMLVSLEFLHPNSLNGTRYLRAGSGWGLCGVCRLALWIL